jgi:protein-L-isoaspartate(D-aspartate) O-methyltransferase
VTVGLRPGLVILAVSLLSVFPASPAWTAPAAPLDEQLAKRGVRDERVLAAFGKVPREAFVAAGASERAYDDQPLPSGYTQTISQPVLLARMIEQLNLKAEDRVLEVGSGTGYAAAVLAELAREVFTVGVIPEMATTARLRLTHEGYQNVHVKLGDGALGWREYGPYDAVIVTTIESRVPTDVIAQLAEGGVLVMVVGPPHGRQVLIRGVKRGFKVYAREIAEIRAVAPRDERGDAGDDRRSPTPSRPPTDDVRGERPPRDADGSRSDR